ncbi:hypothetical protein ACT048_25105 [Ectopseudomonas khazarica]|uniref:hypothetical protein n=1 Tax=Ectopseudomonas khazarica TaxID=2502979 RepID=UPI0015C9B2F2
MVERERHAMQITAIEDATSTLDKLLKEDFLSNYIDEDSIINCLDYRDSEPFDSEWVRVDRIVCEKILNNPDRTKIEKICDQYRKLFYDKVIRSTGSSDLAAYVSEDIELILMAIGTSVSENFAISMLESYKRNIVPGDCRD